MSNMMDEYLSQNREWGVVTRFDRRKGYGLSSQKRTEFHTSSTNHSAEADGWNMDIWWSSVLALIRRQGKNRQRMLL